MTVVDAWLAKLSEAAPRFLWAFGTYRDSSRAIRGYTEDGCIVCPVTATLASPPPLLHVDSRAAAPLGLTDVLLERVVRAADGWQPYDKKLRKKILKAVRMKDVTT